jgi:hypothetical protein
MDCNVHVRKGFGLPLTVSIRALYAYFWALLYYISFLFLKGKFNDHSS